MHPQAPAWFSESQRRSFEKGAVQGEAKGEAKALLLILGQRGLAVTDEQRRRIRECADIATLDRWLVRALSVASVDELLG